MALAVKLKANGAFQEGIYRELRRRGVTPKEARHTVQVLFETKSSAGFLTTPGLGLSIIGVTLCVAGIVVVSMIGAAGAPWGARVFWSIALFGTGLVCVGLGAFKFMGWMN